jgi:hypothetical protein
MSHKFRLTLWVGMLAATAAHAQSFDGLYRGTIRTDLIISAGAMGTFGTTTTCTAEGTTSAIEFRVRSSTITVASRAEQQSGAVQSDGSFKITGQSGSGSGKPIFLEWAGTIRSREIKGTHSTSGPGGQCRASFSARK